MPKKPRREDQEQEAADAQNQVDASQGPERRDREGKALADDFRSDAIALELALSDALAAVSDLDVPLIIGDLQLFPRPSAEAQATEAGLAYLRSSAEGAIGALYALAVAAEQGREISPVLLTAVQPYRRALRRLSATPANPERGED